MEVLLEYLSKYRTKIRSAPLRPNLSALNYEFAGAQVVPHEHRLVRLNQTIHLAPQEIELLRLLSRSVDKVVPYPVLYSELFNQRFAGDTANCRVLLAKLSASFRRLDINLRTFVEVIPKSGYLYSQAIRKPHAQARQSHRPVARDSQIGLKRVR
jgi:DNA-binding winged helix-turn-helix (wHTH) protein